MDPNSEHGKDCLGQAGLSGFKAALQASVVSGSLYLAAMKYSPFFRNTFSASARTALTIMPIFYTGYLRMELSMHKCMQEAMPEYVSIQDDDHHHQHHHQRK
ncbi:hypothetical protein PLESTB_001680000 [Pleodorina starrii]|uniref:Uncharacterized protein n=1 Tax=Pleodorina starrii TaxID=330485 RepID=A0A9W6F928_9CHLO|nr:hypothetical protein PLESTM_001053200 [Pleodorina starrii]GLC60823.1 hypothetical protein PLESTB_001680000 [Pleodorina starrii]GLC66728.1 hypothetical protein PLESTF_000465900 [Pleodorina starrii]